MYEPVYIIIIKTQHFSNEVGHLPLSLKLEVDHWDLPDTREPTPKSCPVTSCTHLHMCIHTQTHNIFNSESLSLLSFLCQSEFYPIIEFT